jgi:hypothetical protein
MDFGIVSVFIPATGAKSDCPSFHLSWAVSFPGPLMKLTHKFAEMTPEKRPQDPNMDAPGSASKPWNTAGSIPTRCHRPLS